MAKNPFSENTPYLHRLAEKSAAANEIMPEMYTQYDVKRGLRDINGRGVLTGLTEISEIVSSKTENGETVPAPGELYYRGINIRDIVGGFLHDGRYGFEECVYLLLMGSLPDAAELAAAIAEAEEMLNRTVGVEGEAQRIEARLKACLVTAGLASPAEEKEDSDFFEKLSLWLYKNYGTQGYSEMLPTSVNLFFKTINQFLNNKILAPINDLF